MRRCELTELGTLDHLGDGPESTVYAVDGDPLVVLKQYHRPERVRFGELSRLAGRVALLSPSDQMMVTGMAAWPHMVVTDGGQPFGVLMARPSDRFMTPDGPRVLPTLGGAEELTPDLRERIGLLRGLSRFVEALHGKDIVLGPGLDRVLWTVQGGPASFVLSCDRFRIVGRASVRPETSEAEPGIAATRADCRNLVVLSLRVLLGRADVTESSVTAEIGGDLDETARRHLRLAAQGTWPSASQWLRALTGWQTSRDTTGSPQ